VTVSGSHNGPLIAATVGVTALAIVLASVAIAVSNSSETGSTSTRTTVDAVLKDFSITAKRTTVREGIVDFQIANAGPSAHEYLVFKTDDPESALPLDPATGRVKEDDPSLDLVLDSGDNVPIGSVTPFHSALTAGNYVLVCNLADHYTKGMHAAFTVTN
jgi:uncharacterized cupredoxin-like copper-binding protein